MNNEQSSANRRVSITTIDNPFNPLHDFDHWFQFDVEQGYYTCNKLARLTNVTDDMSSAEEQAEVERGIDRLIEIDPLNIYTKVEDRGD